MLANAGAGVTESRFRLLYFGVDLKFIAALNQVLTKPNYQLVSSSNYDDAVLFLRSGIPYDLLLIDFDSPRHEGLKLARQARSIRHRKRMPIVLVAKMELSEDTKMLARKAGVTEWVLTTDKVGEVIRQLVGEVTGNGKTRFAIYHFTFFICH